MLPVKRIGNLYQHLYTTGNLVLSLRKALRGKRDKPSVRAFLDNCRGNLRILQQKLAQCTWEPGVYNTFIIHEPKRRIISAAPFPDRVVHHAIINITEPVFERFSIYDSYACRRGKGLHAAISRAHSFQKTNAWFLKLDIQKYFDSIDHNTLKELLARQFKDNKLLCLFNRTIDSAHTVPGKGLPIGNLTSQHFANFYLGHLDHFIKEGLGCKAYARYMDDFCVWGESKSALKKNKARIEAFLENRLKLVLKPTATRLALARYGMPFLGFRLFPHTIRMKGETLKRFVRKIREYDYNIRTNRIDVTGAAQAMQSIYDFAGIADAEKFFRNFARQFAV